MLLGVKQKILAVGVILICMAINSVPVEAEEITVSAVGYYTVGDGPENIAVAKERARIEAMRVAVEKAGVYVESYSKVQNAVLTQDEIRVVSGQVMRIKKDEITVSTPDNKYICYQCEIQAVVNTDVINLKAIMSNRKVVEKCIELEKKIAMLQSENTLLKENYRKAQSNDEKELYAQKIKQNERAFNEAVYSRPIYVGKWEGGLDIASIRYNKNDDTVTFSMSSYNSDATVKTVTEHKLYITSNEFEYLSARCYPVNGSKPFNIKGLPNRDYISPDSAEERISNRIYNYLGITPSNRTRAAEWHWFFSNDTQTYSIDTVNTRIQNVIKYFYVRRDDHKYKVSTTMLYAVNFSNRTVGYHDSDFRPGYIAWSSADKSKLNSAIYNAALSLKK